MNLAAIILLALVLGLFVHDYATLRGRGRRMLQLEALVFLGGAFFIAFPDAATTLAHKVGIGRGVDFLLYPIVIWLVREALVSRHRRFEDQARLTEAVRALAVAQATELKGAPKTTAP
jgi:hypothetical protein